MTKELRYSRGKIIRLCLMLSLMVAIPAYFVSVAWLEHGASVLFGRKMFFLPLVAAMGGVSSNRFSKQTHPERARSSN